MKSTPERMEFRKLASERPELRVQRRVIEERTLPDRARGTGRLLLGHCCFYSTIMAVRNSSKGQPALRFLLSLLLSGEEIAATPANRTPPYVFEGVKHVKDIFGIIILYLMYINGQSRRQTTVSHVAILDVPDA